MGEIDSDSNSQTLECLNAVFGIYTGAGGKVRFNRWWQRLVDGGAM